MPYFKMANIMMKMQLDKMALIFLILGMCGSFYIQIDAVCSSKPLVYSFFSFGRLVKKLSAKNVLAFMHTNCHTFKDHFSQITFKLDIRKTF